jgi:hypothetical protein
MVIEDDATNNFDVFTLRTVSSEYNRMPYYTVYFSIFSNSHKVG